MNRRQAIFSCEVRRSCRIPRWLLVFFENKSNIVKVTYQFNTRMKLDPHGHATVYSADSGEKHHPPTDFVMKKQNVGWIHISAELSVWTAFHWSEGFSVADRRQPFRAPRGPRRRPAVVGHVRVRRVDRSLRSGRAMCDHVRGHKECALFLFNAVLLLCWLAEAPIVALA